MKIPFNVKGGASYDMEFKVNITIPELKFSNESFDFESVQVGNMKTIYLRIENQKEVSCEWSLNTKEKNKAFDVKPNSGLLPPKQKQILHLTFTPTAEKS